MTLMLQGGGLVSGAVSIVLVFLFALATLTEWVLLVAFLGPTILNTCLTSWRAECDYRRARGYEHLKLIRGCLRGLEKRLKELQTRKKDLDTQLAKHTREQVVNVESALVVHLVREHLTGTEGIGPKLRDRLIEECFDGSLPSLHRAGNIRGVGPEKAAMISMWVLKTEKQFPTLLKTPFPGKEEINRKFVQAAKELRQSLEELDSMISSCLALQERAVFEEQWLGRIRRSHFRRSYLEPEHLASRAAQAFLKGSFPEWGKMPAWFEELVAEYGR